VTHSGLLSLARRRRCLGIHARPVLEFCDPIKSRWAFEATVYTSSRSKGFVGYGDADPSNVSPLVQGAEMRVAETRAVNRALRKAYGIGICSAEEIGSFGESRQSSPESQKLPVQPTSGNYGGPKVRDRLCQIIRQRQLDPTLVKAYATDFCGTKTLREATREQVENFVRAPGRLGGKRQKCPALPTQQLFPDQGRCRVKRRIECLHDADRSATDPISDGLFLVRVDRAQYRWHAQKPYCLLRLTVLEPKPVAGRSVTGRVYCTPKALWKLSWFLRDFGYDTELLGRDEIDEKALVGLRGVVKISHIVMNGTSLLNLDGFAPASQWDELSVAPPANVSGSRVPS
jgi:hypothetical protein